jgi:hypothetical protein
MTHRPLSILVIGWLFIAAGSVGCAFHFAELHSRSQLDYELVAIFLIRLAAVLGGVFLLMGANWARWLLAAWMAYHLVLSAMHSLSQFAVHALLFGTIAYFLFSPRATAYFRQQRHR